MPDAFIAWIIVCTITVSFIAGLYAGFSSSRGSLLEDCAREHNVYACELIAMPVDPFHPEEPK